jgi:5-methylcytosine-specific restriction endonuclease McrA
MDSNQLDWLFLGVGAILIGALIYWYESKTANPQKQNLRRMKKSVKTTFSKKTRMTFSKKSDKGVPKKRIPKKLRIDVWNKYIGAKKGLVQCPLCLENEIQQGSCNGWDAGHVIPEANGGETTIDNLRVICKGCNSSMHKKHMKEYCGHYPGAIDRLKLS